MNAREHAVNATAFLSHEPQHGCLAFQEGAALVNALTGLSELGLKSLQTSARSVHLTMFQNVHETSWVQAADDTLTYRPTVSQSVSQARNMSPTLQRDSHATSMYLDNVPCSRAHSALADSACCMSTANSALTGHVTCWRACTSNPLNTQGAYVPNTDSALWLQARIYESLKVQGGKAALTQPVREECAPGSHGVGIGNQEHDDVGVLHPHAQQSMTNLLQDCDL